MYNELNNHKKSDNVKWIAAFVCIAILFVGVIAALIPTYTVRDEADPDVTINDTEIAGGAVIQEMETQSIKLMSARIPKSDYALYSVAPAAESAYTISATVEPADATNQVLTLDFDWVNPDSEWASGKAVGEYFAAVKTGDNTWSLSVGKAFGEQIAITVKAHNYVEGDIPADGAKYQDMRDALEKLKLNDASFVYEPESSIALGFGFRCGFLGLLHMEIIQERLEREYNLDLITTAPNVVYRITKNDGTVLMVDNPLDYPDPMEIQLAEEPYVKVNLMAPQEYVGNIMDLATSRRGEFKDMVYLDANRVELHYDMPLNEIIYDFFDALKSRTRGYGSLDYELIGYRPSKLVKLDILLNGDVVDALSFILFAENAYPRARKICEKLKENIPRAQFEIPVQAAIGGKIIARETIKAVRKDVLAKCYGGDITRKKKLLEKQKEGKKRMRTFGTVSVPSEAFMAVLKLDED